VFIDIGRYATAVVHATKDEIPEIFDRVLSQTPDCHKPTIIKSDNAFEYHTQQLRDVLKKHNVHEQLHSNEHQQFQNGRVEKLVDSICRKIRGMLLQSQMPPEFCGAAVVLATDIYNCTPHRSLDMESPHYHRYHKQPDLSFFCAFGCATVVHRGRDLVEHTKLAPRGELGVYLGVGTSHGRRTFIVYSPRTSRVYATVDARFDETYFPFRTTNQRVYGQDYTPFIQLEQLSLYHDMLNPTVASIVPRLQALPFHVTQHGTSTIHYSFPLPSKTSSRWILRPCAAGTTNTASAGSHLPSLQDRWREVTAPLKDFFPATRRRTPSL